MLEALEVLGLDDWDSNSERTSKYESTIYTKWAPLLPFL